MNQRRISAKQLSEDIKSGMTKLELLNKYKIPDEEKLQALISKLIENGFLGNEHKDANNKRNHCPSCDAEINEIDIECPMCGVIFSKLKSKSEVVSKEKFKNTKKESSLVSNKNKKNNITIVLAVLFTVIIVISSIGLFKYNRNKEKQRIVELQKIEEQKLKNEQEKQEYLQSFFSITNDFLSLVSNSEAIIGEIQKEWYDAIFDKNKKRNINVAIKEAYLKRKTEVDNVKYLTKSVENDLKNLVPPSGKDGEYNRLKEIYLIINRYANMAVYPSGSFQDYSKQHGELAIEIKSVFKEIEMMDTFPKT